MIRRWTFHTLSVLSMALLVACAVCWARSVGLTDSLTYRGNGRTVHRIMTVPHGVAYQSFPVPGGILEQVVSRVPVGWSTRSMQWGKNSYQLTAGGFAVHVTEINQPPNLDNTGLGFGWTRRAGERSVAVPLWLLVTAFSILPVMWIGRLRRDRARRLTGRCLKCGYDLRATPGRCPECGQVTGGDFHPAVQPVESADQ